MKPHYHVIVLAWDKIKKFGNKKDWEGGTYIHFESDKKDRADIITHAKSIMKKDFYHVLEIRECYHEDSSKKLINLLEDQLPPKEPWEKD